jgi:hypothetical protein
MKGEAFKLIGPILVLVIIIFVLFRRNSAAGGAQGGSAPWTVYGTMGCGWTRKQLDHMKENGLEYQFVDCSKNECKGIDAYPVTTHTTGIKLEGYNEIFSNP